MATPKDLIDKTINFYDDVDAQDADNDTHRARLLVFLQHLYSFVWNYLEWEWTYTDVNTITIPGGEDSELLANGLTRFLEFGHNGGLFHPDGRRMTEKSRYEIQNMRRSGGGVGISDPYVFGVFGGRVHIPYEATSDIELSAFYRMAAPELVDDTTALEIPDRYASTVLLPALVYQAQESKNDARDTWGAQFREGLSQMARIEFPEKTTRRKMPLANRGW